jgi:queuine tRNA-ribosyltransferase
LFLANEMLGPILVSLHNLSFYQRLLAEAREAINAGRYGAFADEKLRGLGSLET